MRNAHVRNVYVCATPTPNRLPTITTLILTYFNPNLKYIIKTDLLDYALEGVLLQYNKNGELYLVAFLS